MIGYKCVCMGMGFVALDAIYEKQDQPDFLAGGSCGNVLTILSCLGWDSYPVVRLGKDVEGDRIIQDMKRWGVKTKFIEQEKNSDSPIIIQKLSPRKKLGYRFYSKCEHGRWLPNWKPFLLKSLEAIKDKVPRSDIFYFDRATPSALEMARHQKKQGSVIFFEPTKIFSEDKCFLKCVEISDIVKYSYNPDSPIKSSILKDVQLEIRTMGKDGLMYRFNNVQKQGTWKKLDAFPISDIVDDAGSGDWLSVGLIEYLSRNYLFVNSGTLDHVSIKELEYALKFGQVLAFLNCHYVGARGMMYSMSRSAIWIRAEMIIHKKIKEVHLPYRGPRKTILSKKCRVCTCCD